METYQLVLWIFSLLCSAGYLSWVWIRYGVQPSVSESFYVSQKPATFWFFINAIAVPMILVGGTALWFWAGALLAFVGAAAAFKRKLTKSVHYVGALGGGGFAALASWIDWGLWWVGGGALLFAGAALLFRMKNSVWWIEIVAFALFYAALAIR